VAPPMSAVPSASINVMRMSFHPLVHCHDNRCGILVFQGS
jgi:hypothetical protein